MLCPLVSGTFHSLSGFLQSSSSPPLHPFLLCILHVSTSLMFSSALSGAFANLSHEYTFFLLCLFGYFSNQRDAFSHFLIFPTVSSFSPYILVAICVCDVIYPGDETRGPSTTAKGFSVSIAYCFDLNEDCSLQAHMFAYWFLSWCCGMLRRWTLTGEAGS